MPDKGSPLPKAAAVLSLPGPEKKVVEVSVRECAIHSAVVFKDRAEVKRVVPARLAAGGERGRRLGAGQLRRQELDQVSAPAALALACTAHDISIAASRYYIRVGDAFHKLTSHTGIIYH